MISLKKYERLKIEILLIESDIITSSGLGPDKGGKDENLFGDEGSNSISRMNPLDRPLGIFKRD